MYMRLLQVKLKPEKVSQAVEMYNDRVISTLQKLPQCLYAGFMVSVDHADECVSLTLWDSQESTRAYEQSELFQRLMEEARPLLAESSEWKIELSKDLKLEYQPVPEAPVVKTYSVAGQRAGEATPDLGALHVRIVSMKVKPEKKAELERIYDAEIIPALRAVEGCRYAFLTEGIQGSSEVLSVTIWEHQRAAERYQKSGLFEKLAVKIQHTLSDLYQWKMNLERDPFRQVGTSEDTSVEGYRVVSGKRFH